MKLLVCDIVVGIMCIGLCDRWCFLSCWVSSPLFIRLLVGGIVVELFVLGCVVVGAWYRVGVIILGCVVFCVWYRCGGHLYWVVWLLVCYIVLGSSVFGCEFVGVWYRFGCHHLWLCGFW